MNKLKEISHQLDVTGDNLYTKNNQIKMEYVVLLGQLSTQDILGEIESEVAKLKVLSDQENQEKIANFEDYLATVRKIGQELEEDDLLSHQQYQSVILKYELCRVFANLKKLVDPAARD